MNGPTFIDLFSGAGGLSLGLQDAGWQPLLAVDAWPEAIETHSRNLQSHPAICADVKALDARSLASMVDSEIDWVVGGPPCQGWSTVGRRRWDDDRNDLITEFRRVVEIVRPKNFLIENVLGLRDMQGAKAVQELFAFMGYRVSFHVIRAADFGVPQLRRRVIFVGSRDGGSVLAPNPSHSESEYVSVIEAIGDLPSLGPGETATDYDQRPLTSYQKKMRSRSKYLQGHTSSNHPKHLVEAISFVPDGGNRTAIPDRLQPRSGFHNSYSRLASWRPAVAVTSNMGKPSASRCIHPFQDRGLTAREGARLQSFPDSFHFSGGIVSQRLQVANAVPPLLARSIGKALTSEESWVDAAWPEAALVA